MRGKAGKILVGQGGQGSPPPVPENSRGEANKMTKHRRKYLMAALVVLLFLSATTAYGGQHLTVKPNAMQNVVSSGSAVNTQDKQLGITMDAVPGADGGGPSILQPSGAIVICSGL